MCFEGLARLSRRVWRHFVRVSREISLGSSLHRASTDALIVWRTAICIYPAAGILQSNQIAELLVTRLLRHYHFIITFPLEGGVWDPVHHKTSLVFTSLHSNRSQARRQTLAHRASGCGSARSGSIIVTPCRSRPPLIISCACALRATQLKLFWPM